MKKILLLLSFCTLFFFLKAEESVVVYTPAWLSVDVSQANTYDLVDWESRVLDNFNIGYGFLLHKVMPINIMGLGYPEGNVLLSYSDIRIDYAGGLMSGRDEIAYKKSIQLPTNAKKITLNYYSGGSMGGIQCMDYHAAYILPEGDGFNYATASKQDVVSYLAFQEDNIVSDYRIKDAGDKSPKPFEADLTEYAGQTVTLMFRHYNSGNQTLIMIGGVQITAELDDEVEPNPTAELLMEENFSYTEGDLLDQGSWKANGTGTTNPILVVDTSLTYPGYIDSNIGAAAKITTYGSNNVYKAFEKRYFGSVYASALINFSETKTGTNGADYFMNFNNGDGSTATADGQGRVCIRRGSDETKYRLGVSRNVATATTINWGPENEEYDINTTYLVVLKYTFAEVGNDSVSLFVNPVIGENEPTPYLTNRSNETSAGMSSVGALILRKAPNNVRAYTGIVDAIRVASTWEELFKIPTTKTEIIPNKSDINFGTVYDADQHIDTILIKGRNLSENITLSSSHADVTFSQTTITAKEAKEGVKIAVILNPVVLAAQSANVSIMTAGAALSIPVSWNTRHVDVYPDLGAIQAAYLTEPFDAYVRGLEDVVITDKQVVRSIDMGYGAFMNTYQYFIQDSKGGSVIEETVTEPGYSPKYNLGDTFAKLTGKVVYAAADTIIKFAPELYELVSTNNTDVVSADVASIADLTTNAWNYNGRLVTIPSVVINGLKVTQGEDTIVLKSKYVGTDLAIDFAYLTGIFQTTKAGKNYILPRGANDIQMLSVSSESLDLGNLWFEEAAQFTVTLKGQVTENVTVQLPEYIQGSTTVSKDDINATSGFNLVLTITPQSLGSKSFTLTFVYGDKSIKKDYVFESSRRPSIVLNPATAIDFGTIYIDAETPTTRTINVKGIGLVGDVTVSTTESVVQLATTTIEKMAAEAENGYDLNITVVPTVKGTGYTTITLTTESMLATSSFIVLWTAELPDAVEEITKDQIKTWIDGNKLFVSGTEVAQIDVFTVSGVRVMNMSAPVASLDNLEKGVYIVKIQDKNGKTFANKVILK
jgi:hypothetical protein